jgi:hypothetical protein
MSRIADSVAEPANRFDFQFEVCPCLTTSWQRAHCRRTAVRDRTMEASVRFAQPCSDAGALCWMSAPTRSRAPPHRKRVAAVK